MKPFFASKTPKELRNYWETPPEFLAWAVPRWRLVVDAACTEENKKMPIGLTNSLNLRWADYCPPGMGVFVNPPFDVVEPWARKAIETGNERRMVMLVNAASGARWWHMMAEAATEVWMSRGRMSFVHPVTGKRVDGNNLPQTVFVLEPGRLGERRLEAFDVIDYSKESFQERK